MLYTVALCACGASGSAQSDGATGDGATGDQVVTYVDAPPEPDARTSLSNTFRFAIVGDTRPANEDDYTHYPTAVITKIWDDVQALSPAADFGISTGDYQFSNPFTSGSGSTVTKQFDIYLAARAHFTKAVYAALGNHECTGATASNCGPGNANGVTPNYGQFMSRMVAPLGFTKPYYSINFHADDMSWTAKIVMIAANAWDATQATWLAQQLAVPTTYTFVVRHEDKTATTAPGVSPSETIIVAHPFTLKIVGHTHTYAHYAAEKEVVCGNGGAPLTSGINYGYAVIERLATGILQFTEYDYMTNAVISQFRIRADGTSAP